MLAKAVVTTAAGKSWRSLLQKASSVSGKKLGHPLQGVPQLFCLTAFEGLFILTGSSNEFL
jgi:hypothetical protein